MAAVSDSQLPSLVELRQLRAEDFDPLLEEETRAWERSLDWDFRASAALVRRFLDMQALSGYSLMVNGRPVGYSYYVCEERKGLIGDLYVLERYANPENEERLLASVLEGLMRTPFVKRVESQLMMLRSGSRLALPHWRYLRFYQRNFMEIDLGAAEALRPGKGARLVTLDRWSERRQDEAAALIAASYQGHVDSEINDQYRSPAGARRFLVNIVQYPGCGSFFQPASYVALDRETGRMCGMCLSSLVAADVGHITQVCVSKGARGKAVGYELVRRALLSLGAHHCRKASLTVTGSNQEAIRLYERMGFERVRDFAAYVWEGF
jgi:ribosomal protein S18 acetylase RimI-like enzyme